MVVIKAICLEIDLKGKGHFLLSKMAETSHLRLLTQKYD